MASKKTYKKKYKKYKSKYKKYKDKYKSQRSKKREWRSKARGFEQDLADYRAAWNQEKWDAREAAWKDELMRDYVKRGDYDTAMQQQQQQFQQAQTDLADTILQRDEARTQYGTASGQLTTAQEQLGGQAAQIQDFQSRIADFNAANAAREMQQKVAADYGNLVGTVGSVKANRGASNAYQNRWFRRPQQISGGQIQAMTISDQSTNV